MSRTPDWERIRVFASKVNYLYSIRTSTEIYEIEVYRKMLNGTLNNRRSVKIERKLVNDKTATNLLDSLGIRYMIDSTYIHAEINDATWDRLRNAALKIAPSSSPI